MQGISAEFNHKSIDGTIEVRTEQICNNMSKAMPEFNKALFKPLHKSHSNEIGMQIFEECRTISPAGEINKFIRYSIKEPKNTTITDLCPRFQ